jgi:hypothetical protein
MHRDPTNLKNALVEDILQTILLFLSFFSDNIWLSRQKAASSASPRIKTPLLHAGMEIGS